jgi:hypothetical protein
VHPAFAMDARCANQFKVGLICQSGRLERVIGGARKMLAGDSEPIGLMFARRVRQTWQPRPRH